MDKNCGDTRLSFGNLVNGDTAIAPDRSDQAFGQHSYADTGTDSTIDGFERAKFEVTDADNAMLDQDVLKNLAIRASAERRFSRHPFGSGHLMIESFVRSAPQALHERILPPPNLGG